MSRGPYGHTRYLKLLEQGHITSFYLKESYQACESGRVIFSRFRTAVIKGLEKTIEDLSRWISEGEDNFYQPFYRTSKLAFEKNLTALKAGEATTICGLEIPASLTKLISRQPTKPS